MGQVSKPGPKQFTPLPAAETRSFDLRREFDKLDAVPIFLDLNLQWRIRGDFEQFKVESM